MAILTVEDLRSEYSIKVSDDTVLQSLLDTAERVCLDFAGCKNGEVTEYFDGGSRSVALTYGPIVNVATVEVAGSAAVYRFDSRGHAVIFMNAIPKGNDIVAVKYKCGWEDGQAPRDLKSAIALTVQHLLKLTNGKLMGTLSRTTDGGSEQIEQSIPPIAVKDLLRHYQCNVM